MPFDRSKRSLDADPLFHAPPSLKITLNSGFQTGMTVYWPAGARKQLSTRGQCGVASASLQTCANEDQEMHIRIGAGVKPGKE
jgi:hypothetical protein